MKQHQSFVVLALIIFTMEVNATNYYVHPSGNDDDTGLTSSNAWKTVSRAKLNLKAGDVLLFKRGEEYRLSDEQFRIPSGNATHGVITFTSYGNTSLPKPAILGSIEKNQQTDWSNPVGSLSIWACGSQTTYGADILPNPSFELNRTHWGNWQEGNASITFGRDSSVFDTSPAGSATHIYFSGSLFDNIQIFTYDFNITEGFYKLYFRAKATKPGIIKSVQIFQNQPPWLDYMQAITNSVNLQVNSTWQSYVIKFKTLIYGYNARINFYLGGGFPDNTIFYLDTVKFSPISNYIPYEIGNIIFNNNESATRKSNTALLLKQGDFCYSNGIVSLYSEINPALYYSDIELAMKEDIVSIANAKYFVLDGFSIKYGSSHGISGDNSRNITIRNCDISFIGGGLDSAGYRYGNGIQLWCHCTDFAIEKNKIYEIYDHAMASYCDYQVNIWNIYWRFNIVWNSFVCYLHYYVFDSQISHIHIENNVFAFSGYSWSSNQRDFTNGYHILLSGPSGNITNYYLRNNIFYISKNASIYIDNDFTEYNKIISDYNSFYEPSSAFLFKDLSFVSNWTNFLSVTNQEQHSINSDPQFVSSSLHNFKLLSSSPAINKGILVGVNSDFDENPIPCGNFPDIGPYEICVNTSSSSSSTRNEKQSIQPKAISSSSAIEQYFVVVVVIEFDTTITDVTQLENEIATILGINVNEINVILISSTEIQVTINGQSLSFIQQNANTLIQQINDGTIDSGLLRNAIDAYLRGDNSHSHQISQTTSTTNQFHFFIALFFLMNLF